MNGILHDWLHGMTSFGMARDQIDPVLQQCIPPRCKEPLLLMQALIHVLQRGLKTGLCCRKASHLDAEDRSTGQQPQAQATGSPDESNNQGDDSDGDDDEGSDRDSFAPAQTFMTASEPPSLHFYTSPIHRRFLAPHPPTPNPPTHPLSVGSAGSAGHPTPPRPAHPADGLSRTSHLAPEMSHPGRGVSHLAQMTHSSDGIKKQREEARMSDMGMYGHGDGDLDMGLDSPGGSSQTEQDLIAALRTTWDSCDGQLIGSTDPFANPLRWDRPSLNLASCDGLQHWASDSDSSAPSPSQCEAVTVFSESPHRSWPKDMAMPLTHSPLEGRQAPQDPAVDHNVEHFAPVNGPLGNPNLLPEATYIRPQLDEGCHHPYVFHPEQRDVVLGQAQHDPSSEVYHNDHQELIESKRQQQLQQQQLGMKLSQKPTWPGHDRHGHAAGPLGMNDTVMQPRSAFQVKGEVAPMQSRDGRAAANGGRPNTAAMSDPSDIPTPSKPPAGPSIPRSSTPPASSSRTPSTGPGSWLQNQRGAYGDGPTAYGDEHDVYGVERRGRLGSSLYGVRMSAGGWQESHGSCTEGDHADNPIWHDRSCSVSSPDEGSMTALSGWSGNSREAASHFGTPTWPGRNAHRLRAKTSDRPHHTGARGDYRGNSDGHIPPTRRSIRHPIGLLAPKPAHAGGGQGGHPHAGYNSYQDSHSDGSLISDRTHYNGGTHQDDIAASSPGYVRMLESLEVCSGYQARAGMGMTNAVHKEHGISRPGGNVPQRHSAAMPSHPQHRQPQHYTDAKVHAARMSGAYHHSAPHSRSYISSFQAGGRPHSRGMLSRDTQLTDQNQLQALEGSCQMEGGSRPQGRVPNHPYSMHRSQAAAPHAHREISQRGWRSNAGRQWQRQPASRPGAGYNRRR